MNQQNVQMFLINNQNMFNTDQLPMIGENLLRLDDSAYILITSPKYKDPTTVLLLSIFLGYLGVDRFVIGDTGIGVLKLLTFGCLGILTIIDWFTIKEKTRQKNFELFMQAVSTQRTVNPSKPPEKLQASNTVDDLRKLKALFDEGILTQEEFDRKKQELLNR